MNDTQVKQKKGKNSVPTQQYLLFFLRTFSLEKMENCTRLDLKCICAKVVAIYHVASAKQRRYLLAKDSCPGRMRAACSNLIPLALFLCNQVNGQAELCCSDLAFTAGHYQQYLQQQSHYGKVRMLRSRPPAAAYYKFKKKTPGLVLDASLMERFLSHWQLTHLR